MVKAELDWPIKAKNLADMLSKAQTATDSHRERKKKANGGGKKEGKGSTQT